jgi:hypothetical protein
MDFTGEYNCSLAQAYPAFPHRLECFKSGHSLKILRKRSVRLSTAKVFQKDARSIKQAFKVG